MNLGSGWRRLSGMAVVATALGLTGCAGAPTGVPMSCPQPRFTGQAPPDYLRLTNPLSLAQRDARVGEPLYREARGRAACSACHGDQGEGNGPLAAQFDPPPRNFACTQTIAGIPDGQLFWVIRFGSPATAMPAHPDLTDEQVWQLVTHLRRLSTRTGGAG